ncbi:DUF222 domain-containing protein [Tessaracoccus defluvii]|uniref:DUF222 domain-containing protein n=1 Tax=Tessaracoccus defluvii TaxID=1285901 RepID=A0A7H0H6Y5_9ACTN|nr:DUF222 domain-containing protein [Tessaracoccus defluvii]QNP56301.1 DUF222 domain-containing protein [Tessaracoccus defluvii]
MDTVTVREVAESIRSADEWRRRAEVEVILGICRFAEGYSVDRDELVEALVERQIRLGGDGTPLVSEFVSLELAGLLRCSPTVAGNRIVEALDLKHRHPGLLAAVEAFESEPSWALRAARRCHQLSIELADRVTDRWLTRIRGLGWTAAFNLLERLIVSTDAELAAERERRARESRGVYVWGLDDGVMNLTGRLDATDARWFDDALSQVAAVLEAEHPGLTAEQRRAKAVGVLAHPALALALLQRAAQPLLPLDGKPGRLPWSRAPRVACPAISAAGSGCRWRSSGPAPGWSSICTATRSAASRVPPGSRGRARSRRRSWLSCSATCTSRCGR